MAAPNLADLIVAATVDEVLAAELTTAASVGMPTSAWQPLTPERTILYTNATVVANYSQSVALLAQGGYASLAATMVDSNGNPITEWMDLIGVNNYAVTRLPATFASLDGTTSPPQFTVSNNNAAGPNFGPFGTGQVIFVNSTTGATFVNSAPISAIGPGTSAGVSIVAQVAGSGSTSGLHAIDALATPVTNIACDNIVAAVGSDAESNANYLTRCQAKLGSLSPKGASKAYAFVATSIFDTTQPWYDLYGLPTEPITRVQVYTAPGVVYVYIANAAGAPISGDVSIVNDYIQNLVVPDGQTAIVQAASQISINFTYNVFVPTASGFTSGQVESAISTALTNYLQTVPIGGLTDASPGVVPWSALVATIMEAQPGTVSPGSKFVAVTLSSPAADVPVGFNEVAVPGTITPTVTFV